MINYIQILRVSFIHSGLRIGVGDSLIADILFADMDDEDAFIIFMVFVTKLKNYIQSVGPWLFGKLPTGTYHLEASIRGDRKRIYGVRVEEGSQKVVSMQW